MMGDYYPERHVVAFHESGHAVVAEVAGIGANSIWVGYTGSASETLRAAGLGHLCGPDHWFGIFVPQHPERHGRARGAVVNVAGYVAEALAEGTEFDVDAFWDLAVTGDGDARSVRSVAHEWAPRDPRAWVCEVAELAYDVLVAVWHRVEALAAAVLATEHGVLKL